MAKGRLPESEYDRNVRHENERSRALAADFVDLLSDASVQCSHPSTTECKLCRARAELAAEAIRASNNTDEK